MAKQSYWELLRDPRWQKKRLEIMNRAGFRCEKCDASDKTLNVHHGYYSKGMMPWEYPNESLRCFCEDCHAIVQELQGKINEKLSYMSFHELEMIVGVIDGTLAERYPEEQRFNVATDDYCDGIAMSQGVVGSGEFVKAARAGSSNLTAKQITNIGEKGRKLQDLVFDEWLASQDSYVDYKS